MATLQTGAFVGRERELEELLGALDETGSGRGRVILIGGEPGIGKSRLADELGIHARDRGHEVLVGRGWEDAGAPAYWSWVQALRSHIRSTDPDVLRRQMGPGAGDIAQMLPELRDLLPDVQTSVDVGSESARFQLFDSTSTFLRNAGLDRPILVILDDLQAADTPSILFLRFLASQLNDMRLLLVGTYRDIELTPDHPLTAAIDEIARASLTGTMILAGLDAEAVGRYIQTAANLSLPDRLVGAVWRETSGNPLFVSEAVRLLSAEGHLSETADLPSLRLAVPASVRAVIARRIEHLDPTTVAALRLGASLGPEFSVEVLRRVGGFEGDEAIDLVDDAVRAGLLVAVAGVPGRFRFSHDLFRESLYGDLSSAWRARLHRRIADVLESVHAGSLELHLAELAFHYGEAATGPEPDLPDEPGERSGDKAVDYARRAGDRAARSLAYEEADRLYRMALAGWDLTGSADEAARTEILLALGEVQARAGDFDRAMATYLKAADVARQTGNARHLAQAAIGYSGRLPWARPGRDTRMITLLQDALVMSSGVDDRMRVRLLTRLACAWRSSPDRRNESATLSQQAVQIARELDDLETLTYALAGRYWAIWWPENPDERHPIAAEMVRVAGSLGDAERLIDAHLMLFMDHSEAGRMAEARNDVDTVTRLAEELRQPAQAWLGVSPRAAVALMDGDFGLAEELIRRETETRRQVMTARDDESAARMHRFLLRREQGRLAEEEATVRASVDDFPWYPLHRAALACLLLDLGRDVEARVVFDDLARDAFSAVHRDNEWLLGMSLASEACSVLGDVPAAAILFDQLVPFAGRHAMGHAEGSVGAVDRYLGLLAVVLGRPDDAARRLAAAIAINDGMGLIPWSAHCQHDLAVVLRSRAAPGDIERAAAHDAAALATARRLGMVLAARIEAPRPDAVPPDAAPQLAARDLAAGTFRREGDYWTIAFGTDLFRVRDAKGMRHLARLLERPGQEVHALELARSESPGPEVAQGFDPSLTSDGFGDAGAALDPEAKAAYRARLDDLREELTEAEAWNDPERAARAQAEIAALTHELAAAVGLGGRDRMASSAAERARISVTRAIRSSLARIGDHSTDLGAHLDATIRTGTFCSYTPDPRAPIAWRL